jgi:hypothetical protein
LSTFTAYSLKQIYCSFRLLRFHLARLFPKEKLRFRPVSLLLRRVTFDPSSGKINPLRWVHVSRLQPITKSFRIKWPTSLSAGCSWQLR